MADDRVILSEEPGSVKININDPNKPKQNNAGKMVKVPKKIPFWDRIISALFGQEVTSQNLGEYVINEYAIPTGKKLLNNGIQSTLKRTGEAAQVMIFGKVINSSDGPTDYTSYSDPNNVKKVQGAYRVMDQVDTFAFRRHEDAEACLNYLKGRIKTYGSTSVVDYFEWINDKLGMTIPLDYNMTDRGFLDLSNVRVIQTAEGYIIDFPRPVFLKRG